MDFKYILFLINPNIKPNQKKNEMEFLTADFLALYLKYITKSFSVITCLPSAAAEDKSNSAQSSMNDSRSIYHICSIYKNSKNPRGSNLLGSV